MRRDTGARRNHISGRWIEGYIVGSVRGIRMEQIADWNGVSVKVAKSSGGVVALVNPWENLIRTSITPWPPPELVQKLYQSRQTRAYTGDSFQAATSVLGFYSDLQSSRSEDAITWSFFGPIAYAEPAIRSKFVSDLLSTLGLDSSPSKATVWLWRRLPHPDSLVPGGSEIDFVKKDTTEFLIREAKWRSAVNERQGLGRDKSQITLRQEFCQSMVTEFYLTLAISLFWESVATAE